MAERSRDWIWGAVVLAVLAVGMVILAPPSGQLAGDHRLSTLRTTPDGAAALYGTLEELGIPVDRRLTPLVGVEPIRGPLALLAPTEIPTPTELDSLFSWVEAGGRLLVVAPSGDLRERLGVAARYAAGDAPMEAVPGHPWTTGLDTIQAVGWVIRGDTLRGDEIRPLIVEPDSGGIAVGVLARGAGEVLLVSSAAPLTTGRIRAAGIAPVLARAAAGWTAGGDTLRFDEYHHGHRGGSAYGAVATVLGRGGAGWVALQLALVALLALLAAATRFGSPVDADVAPRRSRLEHVAALGEVYRRAGAEELARRRVLGGLARRIGRERPSPSGEALFLERLERNVVTGRAEVKAVAQAWKNQASVPELARRIDEAVNQLNAQR